MRARRDQRVAQKLDIFGRGQGQAGLLRIGEPRALLGRRSSEYRRDDSGPEWMVWIKRKDRFSDFDPAAETVPVLIEGRVTGRDSNEPRIPLAISINGRIEALTRTFGTLGRFTAMLPESALKAGRNQLEVHRIVAGADSIALAPIHVARQPGVRESDELLGDRRRARQGTARPVR